MGNDSQSTRFKQVCYSEVLLPNGKLVERMVIVLNHSSQVVNFYPLEKEEPFTEWRDERFVLTEDMLAHE